jgi:hypothetical protein
VGVPHSHPFTPDANTIFTLHSRTIGNVSSNRGLSMLPRAMENSGSIEEREVKERTDEFGAEDRVGGLMTRMSQPIRAAGAINMRKEPARFGVSDKRKQVLRRG